MNKTLASTTVGNEKLAASKMMLLSSNRRIHSIHSVHQPSEATRENPTSGSTPETVMQSRPTPSSTPVSGPAPSLDEDDHLTINKLKTQHLQTQVRAPQLLLLLHQVKFKQLSPLLLHKLQL